MSTSEEEKNVGPVHELKVGAIRAAIWENSGRNGPWHTVTFSRLFKDGDRWRDSTNFGRDDLPHLMKVAEEAMNWIYAAGR